jgi:hypothetical protein
VQRDAQNWGAIEENLLSPFGLSLSKPCSSLPREKEQGFDKLRTNGS